MVHRQKYRSGLPRWHFPTGPCFAAKGGASSVGAQEPLRPRFPGMENGASILSLEAVVHEHREAEWSLICLLLTGAASQCSVLGVSSCSAQCRRGQGMEAPAEP